MKVAEVGVVGCGLMGAGIAEVAARAGYRVRVREVSQDLLERGLERVRASLERGRQRGKLSAEEKEAALGRIQGTLDLGELGGCDLVVEAVVEEVGVKRQVFADLGRITRSEAILASNTSSIAIMEMAAASGREEQVIGIHFFNPVPVMRLVEVIRSLATAEATLEISLAWVRSLGKEPVVCQDTPGFIVNALLVPYLMSAIRMLESGIASAEDIDKAVRLGLGHPMGPFELLDLVGLDTHEHIGEVLYQEYRDRVFAAPPLLKRMVLGGRLGRKSGRGFYEYDRPT